MVEFVSEVTAVARIVVFIANYNSYRYGKRKEDDLAVRRRIMEEVEKGRQHCLNLLETAYRTNNMAVEGELKGLRDNLDLFKNEVHLAEVGHKYPFFSEQRSTKMKSMKKLVQYDATILEEAAKTTQQLADLELELASGEGNPLAGVRAAKGSVATARGAFRDRLAFIKGAKEV